MRQLLGLILVLLVLLCGCTQQAPDSTTPTDESTVPEASTDPIVETTPGLYLPQSGLEEATKGAVMCYEDVNGCYGSLRLDDGTVVLLRQKDGEGFLELYGENELIHKKTLALGEGVFPLPGDFCITEQGVSYYDSVDEATVFLNSELRETGRMQMPDDINGMAWLSPDWTTVYYGKEDGFYTMDLQTGISRLLREHPSKDNRVTGLLADGTVLRCVEENQQGEEQTLLINALTGAVLNEGTCYDTLVVWEDLYFFERYEGAVLRLHCGTGTEPSEIIWPKEEGSAYAILPENALVMVTEQEDGTMLTYYRLDTGTRHAQVFLRGISKAYDLRADGDGIVCFLAETAEGESLLCRWDPSKSVIEEAGSCKAPCYTAENPDSDSLALLIAEAKALGDQYGVEIYLWTDAAQLAPSDHIFEAEHLKQAYERFLPELEQALSFFPEGFFKRMPGEKLKIAVVRAMIGDTEQGSLAKSTNLQFWNGKEPVIGLAIGYDTTRNFCHAMAHLIDTQVLSHSADFYEWNTLNPEGFAYDNNYIVNADRTDTTYTEGDNRYFIDLFSMSFAKEDRARIFEYACMSGNEEIFKSPVLQEKLRRICKGIRNAFDLRNVETAFPWEQYLTT